MFMDHKLASIQDYIRQDIIDKYSMIDVNVFQENIFHTKYKLKTFDLDNYFFNFLLRIFQLMK